MFAYTKLMQAMAAAGVVSATDPYFNLVTLLLPGNGTNGAQNNTFLDSSTNNFTITRNGNTTQGTFSPFSQTGWSVSSGSSSSDMLSTASSAAFAFGSGDFTMEAFVFATASQTDNWIIGLANNCWLRIGSAGKLEFYNSVAATSTLASAAMPLNQWVHVAVVRSGTALTIYENGISVATATVSTNFSANVACTIGNQSGVDRRWNGYMSNVRVVKGTAVYTAAFTPPTSALTAITNTSLLTCQSNRFIDNSTNAFSLTVNGTPSVQAFSPFAPTAAYSAATNGGSGYFDGTGDYLTVAYNSVFNLNTGPWTIEFWVYPTASGTQWWGQRPNTSTFAPLKIGLSGTNLNLYGSSTNTSWNLSFTGTKNVNLNAWNHIVVQHTGTNYVTYINGAIDTNTAGSTPYSSTNAQAIGATTTAGDEPFTGYIGAVRVIKNQALYSGSTITIPNAPLTTTGYGSTSQSITGTVGFLMGFTNAGITDATAKNVLETVGNAQISTTQSKFGGSSMYFDGTGDYLISPNNVNLQFGTGDFTIEGWIYLTTLGSERSIFAKGTSNTGWAFNLNSANKLMWLSTTSAYVAATAISANTWYHVAATRENGTLRLFLNGSLDLTQASLTTDYNQTNNLQIGLSRDGSWPWVGYLDDLRITKGLARYTSSFTPTTSAFALQ
jgi:hypothetical protein